MKSPYQKLKLRDINKRLEGIKDELLALRVPAQERLDKIIEEQNVGNFRSNADAADDYIGDIDAATSGLDDAIIALRSY